MAWLPMLVLILALGVYPHLIFKVTDPALSAMGATFAALGVFFAVGILEVVSIVFRPISLSFRLFGNVYAGETILESMSHMVPAFAWLIPIPFYFMELLVGLVQALVFMLLTAVFTLLMCQHEEGPAAAHD